ncbi:MAG TPA: M28 family peptidase [bacterium]|nr:M28 family peptidase [bacterium]
MPKDPEQAVRQAVSAAKLMEYTRGVSRWVRMSGSEQEAQAFDYLEATLRALGLDVHRYQHDALISWPGKASLEVVGTLPRQVECITHAFSAPTPPGGLEGEVVDAGAGDFTPAVQGKIVLVDGLAMPVKAQSAEAAGAVGAIFINPPELHEMIISTVWGSPTPETVGYLPKIAAVSVRESDGAVLRARAREGTLRVRLHAEVDTRWRPTPILTADLKGTDEPDRYVLFSGHVDSWHYGVMDNGSANAVMVETARLMSKRRRRLRRGLRLAFWSGHSHGRYSGSVWYADHHWRDLYRNAVLHLNVDSSGAKGSTVLSEGETMAETWASAARAIKDVTGQDLEHRRISRMGDQSFWGVGVPSMFGGVSVQPPAESATSAALASLHGGAKKSGGLGWWWHTTDDTIDKIDRANLHRDAEIYALVVWRWCTAPVLPLDYRATAAELRETLRHIQDAAGEAFDLDAPLDAVTRLAGAAERLHDAAARVGTALGQARGTRKQRAAASLINDTLMRAGRALIPINYTSTGPFDHDRAVPIPPVPSLQAAARLRTLPRGTDEYHTLEIRLVRDRNRVTHAIEGAADMIEHAFKHIDVR